MEACYYFKIKINYVTQALISINNSFIMTKLCNLLYIWSCKPAVAHISTLMFFSFSSSHRFSLDPYVQTVVKKYRHLTSPLDMKSYHKQLLTYKNNQTISQIQFKELYLGLDQKSIIMSCVSRGGVLELCSEHITIFFNKGRH